MQHKKEYLWISFLKAGNPGVFFRKVAAGGHIQRMAALFYWPDAQQQGAGTANRNVLAAVLYQCLVISSFSIYNRSTKEKDIFCSGRPQAEEKEEEQNGS